MITLYSAPLACSLAVHVALEEAAAEFEVLWVHLRTGEQNSADYRKIHPLGYVPALVVDGQTITEAAAILTFIAGLRPEAKLIPAPATIEHARCCEWLAFLSSSVHVAFGQFVRPTRFLHADSRCLNELADDGRARTIDYYREIERRLAGRSWASGDHYSIADIYLLPFFRWASRLEFAVHEHCPRWASIIERMEQRPAVERAISSEEALLASGFYEPAQPSSSAALSE